ncbi:SIMPL domain-containing protein [Streptomyces sp. NPDC002540]
MDTWPTPHRPTAPPSTPRVAARGEARIEVEPETAHISITVTARGKDRRTALEDLTRRNGHVLELARSYGPAVEKLETGTLSITPELTEHGHDEKVRAHHGRVHVTVVLNDFTALGEFTTRIADLDMTRINSPWWGPRPDSPAHANARRQAVHETVQRAREYADALGARLTALVELADLGAENTAPAIPMPTAPGSTHGRAAYNGATTEPTAPDLEPQRQTVHAQVNARFTMSPPQL